MVRIRSTSRAARSAETEPLEPCRTGCGRQHPGWPLPDQQHEWHLILGIDSVLQFGGRTQARPEDNRAADVAPGPADAPEGERSSNSMKSITSTWATPGHHLNGGRPVQSHLAYIARAWSRTPDWQTSSAQSRDHELVVRFPAGLPGAQKTRDPYRHGRSASVLRQNRTTGAERCWLYVPVACASSCS